MNNLIIEEFPGFNSSKPGYLTHEIIDVPPSRETISTISDEASLLEWQAAAPKPGSKGKQCMVFDKYDNKNSLRTIQGFYKNGRTSIDELFYSNNGNVNKFEPAS